MKGKIKHQTTTLAGQEEFLRKIIDSLPRAIAVLDVGAVICLVNKEWVDLLDDHQHPDEQSGVGSDYFQVCQAIWERDQEITDTVREAVNDILTGKKDFFQIEYLCNHHVQPQWYLLRITPIDHNSNRYLLMSHKNISHRKRHEQAAAIRQAHLEAVFRAAPAGIGLVVDRKLQQVNERFCEMIGYQPQELIGQSARMLYFTQEDYEYVGHEKYRQIRERGTGSVEVRMRRKDGTAIDMILSSTPLDIADLQAGVVFTATDITRLKKVQRDLKDKNEELQSIVYITSHDLKTPLINIHGFTGEMDRGCKRILELLEKEALSEETRRAVQEIFMEDIQISYSLVTSGIDKMNSLLQGLLHIARVGTREMMFNQINVRDMVRSICRSMEYKLHEKDISIEVRDMPDCVSDETLLNQLFTNLIDNAVKYIPDNRKGIIQIAGQKDGADCRYWVTDNGIGIAPEHQKRIFDIFHRLNPGAPCSGEGVGLTIVKRILSRLNGSVQVESEPDRGSRFLIQLPTASAQK